MAKGRGRSGNRREPVFDTSPELRVEAADRSAPAPIKPAPRRKKTSARKRRGPRRSLIGRIAYWSWCSALWVGIGGVGVDRLGRRASAADPVAGNSQAPAVDPDRRTQQAARWRRRGDMGGESCRSRSCRLTCRRPSSPSRTGASTHYGVDPFGIARARRRQRAASRRLAGRLDHHAAARQEPVPDAGAHDHAQAAGGDAGALAGAQIHQEPRSSSSISTASISAPAPTASSRRRSAISASRRAT